MALSHRTNAVKPVADCWLGFEIFGYISLHAGSGYSRLLSVAGPYGNPTDMDLYAHLFGKAT